MEECDIAGMRRQQLQVRARKKGKYQVKNYTDLNTNGKCLLVLEMQ